MGGEQRDRSKVIINYIESKQTLKQLSKKYGVSSKTVHRDLEGMRHVMKMSKEREVIIQIDMT